MTLFLWHIPDDATESVTKHSTKLQPTINLHAPVTIFVFSISGPEVLPQMDEGSGKPSAVVPSAAIEPYSILAPTQVRTQTQVAGFEIRSSNHFATTASTTAHVCDSMEKTLYCKAAYWAQI